MPTAVERAQDDVVWLLDCVNEYSTATREAADELGMTLPVLPGGPQEAATLSAEELVTVANGWFEVFRAAPDPDAVAAVLNGLLAAAEPTVAAVHDADGVHSAIRLAPEVDGLTRLSAWGALVLLEVVDDLGVDRFGLCSGDRCVDVYIDRSPLHNRRYCSQLCQTRERVSRYRGRK